MCLVFIVSGVYYAYDGNMAYFTGDWSRFEQGRLGGPAKGAYGDNNKFAVLLVITFPFLLFGFFFCKNVVLKTLTVVGMMLVIHCIFLTGSRGALLALGSSVFICSRSIKSRFFSYAIVVAFIAVVILQAQGTLNRGKEVVRNNEAEEVMNPRIKSWTVGMKLMTHYPILGTGLYRFREASFFHYPGETPHVAHNTLITFTVSSGIVCGFLYLYLFYRSYKMRQEVIRKAKPDTLIVYAANSSFAALIGFFVGAIFLDMMIFEPFYYLIMLLTATYFLQNHINNPDNVTENKKG
ncbi:hypothetical protein KUL49_08990 [Alteromonas sp. KUL49]|nr:hypothetical protein KUL49_08990 [Alteromonas sp. KUL49]